MKLLTWYHSETRQTIVLCTSGGANTSGGLKNGRLSHSSMYDAHSFQGTTDWKDRQKILQFWDFEVHKRQQWNIAVVFTFGQYSTWVTIFKALLLPIFKTKQTRGIRSIRERVHCIGEEWSGSNAWNWLLACWAFKERICCSHFLTLVLTRMATDIVSQENRGDETSIWNPLLGFSNFPHLFWEWEISFALCFIFKLDLIYASFSIARLI